MARRIGRNQVSTGEKDISFGGDPSEAWTVLFRSYKVRHLRSDLCISHFGIWVFVDVWGLSGRQSGTTVKVLVWGSRGLLLPPALPTTLRPTNHPRNTHHPKPTTTKWRLLSLWSMKASPCWIKRFVGSSVVRPNPFQAWGLSFRPTVVGRGWETEQGARSKPITPSSNLVSSLHWRQNAGSRAPPPGWTKAPAGCHTQVPCSYGGVTSKPRHHDGRFRNPRTPSPNWWSGKQQAGQDPRPLLMLARRTPQALVHSLGHLATMKMTMCNVEMDALQAHIWTRPRREGSPMPIRSTVHKLHSLKDHNNENHDGDDANRSDDWDS